MIVIVGIREDGKSVWAYPSSGGVTPTWTADTGGNTNAVAYDSSGNFFIVGDIAGGKNIWKYNTTGTLLASYLVGTAQNLLSIVVLPDDTICVGGSGNGTTCWILNNGITSDSTFGTILTGSTEALAVSKGETKLLRLALSTNLRSLTYEQWDISTLTRNWSIILGTGADISAASVSGAGLMDGNWVLCLSYSIGIMYYINSSNGSIGGYTNSANNFYTVWGGTDGYTYLGMAGFLNKYSFAEGAFSEEWSSGYDETTQSNFFENSGGVLSVCSWGAPE